MDHRSAMSAEVDCGWKVKVVESESDKKLKIPQNLLNHYFRQKSL